MSQDNHDKYTNYITHISRGDVSHVVKKNTPRPESEDHSEEFPWHQQQLETGQAYAAFRIYIDIGTNRSQATVSEVVYGSDKVSEQIRKWSVRHDWVKRAEAWDRFLSETHISHMESTVIETEKFAMRWLLPVTIRLKEVALGEISVKREELSAMNSYLDRFGVPKQRAQQPIVNNQWNVSFPSLPGESTARFSEVKEAEYEVLESMAAGYIPEKLKK